MSEHKNLSKLSIWVMAARPKTLWAAVSPVMIGTAMAYEAGCGSWFPAIAALFGAIMIQIGTNFANDYFDWKKGADTEDRLGPTRVTQAGLVRPETIKLALIIAFLMAGASGAYLTWHAGWPLAIICITSVLSGIFYTAGPYPLAYIGLGDLFVLIFFGPVAVGGTYYVQALEIQNTVLLAGLAPGLFSVAILTVNNLRDIDNDRKSGKRTLAVRLGKNFAKGEYLLSIILGSFIPIVLAIADFNHPLSLLTVILPIIAIPSIKKVFCSSDGATLNSVLAGTGKLLLIYSIIFSIGWLV